MRRMQSFGRSLVVSPAFEHAQNSQSGCLSRLWAVVAAGACASVAVSAPPLVTFAVTSSWDTGYNGEIRIQNRDTTPIPTWQLVFDNGPVISSLWNGTHTLDGVRHTVNNAGWNALLDLVREDLKVLDDSWHWIPEEAASRRMEARATKMAYVHLTNIIDICKDDLKRSLQLIEEIKSTELDS
jgi:hypothetical protein